MRNGAGQLDFDEAKELVGCSRNWLQTRMRHGQIAYIKVGRQTWFEEADLLTAQKTLGQRAAIGLRPLRRQRSAR